MPGTDHAAIATEVKVVEKMKKEEGLTKADITREQFLERAWAWTKEDGGTIQKQQKRCGFAGTAATSMLEIPLQRFAQYAIIQNHTSKSLTKSFNHNKKRGAYRFFFCASRKNSSHPK